MGTELGRITRETIRIFEIPDRPAPQLTYQEIQERHRSLVRLIYQQHWRQHHHITVNHRIEREERLQYRNFQTALIQAARAHNNNIPIEQYRTYFRLVTVELNIFSQQRIEYKSAVSIQ